MSVEKSKLNLNMDSQFINFYVANMTNLFSEIKRNQQVMQLVTENIQTLTSDLQKEFNQLVVDMIKKPTLKYDDKAARDLRIKNMFFQIREIQKCEHDKRALTRQACNILDNYFTSLEQSVEKAQSNLVTNTGDVPDQNELAKTLASIKLHLDKPVEGIASVVDVIRQIKDGAGSEKCDQKANGTVSIDGTGNIDYFSTFRQSRDVTLDDMLKGKTRKGVASDMTLQTDSLQAFIDKVVDICSAMKYRYGTSTSTAQSDCSTNDDNDAEMIIRPPTDDEDENAELCYCRAPESGQMVQCDNAKCKIRWYHFECVALLKSPVGKWFCPTCIIFNEDEVDYS